MIDVVLQIMTWLNNLLLSPIDNFISNYLPDVSIIFTYIANFLNYILSFFVWAISWVPLEFEVLDIMFDVLILFYAWRAFVIPISGFISFWRAIHS